MQYDEIIERFLPIIKKAKDIQRMDAKSARWIASGALRELTGDAVQRRLTGRIVTARLCPTP